MCFKKKKKENEVKEQKSAVKPVKEEKKVTAMHEDPETDEFHDDFHDEANEEVTKVPHPDDNIHDNYHISQNKDSESRHYLQWRIRKEGSEKTMKFFKTQKEAIEYAHHLHNAYSRIKIHGVHGKIRKE